VLSVARNIPESADPSTRRLACAPIHRSAWNRNSANFALTEF
jgi:hypothetical protein